jgi:hypothetical protein
VIVRDEARCITWYDGVAVTDEEMNKMDKVQPTSAQVNARDDVAGEIFEALTKCIQDAGYTDPNLVRVDKPVETVGPLGGVSSRVSTWLEDEDGTLHAVSVVVYCDDNVRRSLVADIEAGRLKHEENERVRGLVLGD